MLIGATTENPYYEINSPLLSRMRVYRLEPLETEALGTIVDRALIDPDRGLAGRVTLLPDDARRRCSTSPAATRARPSTSSSAAASVAETAPA